MEEAPAPEAVSSRTETGTCTKRGRFWAVTDGAGRLVCLAVYRKGGREVLRRLALSDDQSSDRDNEESGTTEKSDTTERRKRGGRG